MGKRPERSILKLPSDLFYLPAIQAFAREVAGKQGFAGEDIEKILLGVEEAVANVIEHAFDREEGASYEIIFEPNTEGLRVIVKDQGLPLDTAAMDQYRPPSDIDHMASGLGSFLMKKSMDELSFHNLGREGKELHMVKYLPCKSVLDYHSPAELEAFPEPPTGEAPSLSTKAYVIRAMDNAEAFEVSKLFYRAYGYLYGIDCIYYPDRFAQLHRGGSIFSVVTATEDNEIAGHAALVKDEPESRVAEAAMAVVHPDFRGRGCQNQMLARLVEQGREAGLLGIYSKAVTNHPYAQKAGQKAGFKRCALVVGLIPSDRAYKGIHASLSQRDSVAYGYLPIQNPAGITLYPPEHHREFIEKIYRSIGLDRVFQRAPDSSAPDETSLIKTTVVSSYNRAVVEVHRYGKNAVSEIRAILKDLRLKKTDEITLNLNLGDPLTQRLCKEFEDLGFFIAGVLPFYHVGDTLILQYLNNVPIDYSRIEAASEALEEIRCYVRDHDPNIR